MRQISDAPDSIVDHARTFEIEDGREHRATATAASERRGWKQHWQRTDSQRRGVARRPRMGRNADERRDYLYRNCRRFLLITSATLARYSAQEWKGVSALALSEHRNDRRLTSY